MLASAIHYANCIADWALLTEVIGEILPLQRCEIEESTVRLGSRQPNALDRMTGAISQAILFHINCLYESYIRELPNKNRWHVFSPDVCQISGVNHGPATEDEMILYGVRLLGW